MSETPKGTKAYYFTLPDDVGDALREHAYKKRMTLKEVVVVALRKFLGIKENK